MFKHTQVKYILAQKKLQGKWSYEFVRYFNEKDSFQRVKEKIWTKNKLLK